MNKYRKKIIAGNWKMNQTSADAASLAGDIKVELAECREVDVVLCPPFTSLKVVSEIVADSHIRVGAQNMHWETAGAYTGEISPGMLRDLYCHYVILGHSERRHTIAHHEDDQMINSKVKAAIAGGLCPILCVGETLAEREAGQMLDVLTYQITADLHERGWPQVVGDDAPWDESYLVALEEMVCDLEMSFGRGET